MFTIQMDEIDRIIQIYERQAEECVRAVSGCYEEIISLARKTTYKPMVDYGNAIYRFYMGDLRSHLKREFQNWYDGSYSFHALMRAIDAGEEAVAEAKNKMDDMGRTLDQLFRLPQSEIHLGTSVPKVEDKDFEAYNECLRICSRKFEQAVADAESQIRAMEGGNDVVRLIGDIVKTTGESLTQSFAEMRREVTIGHDLTNTGTQRTISEITNRGIAADAHIPWGKGQFM